MQITRTSNFTGITRTRDLPVTPEQFQQWSDGALVQKAFPNLSESDREFLMTGATQEEWDKYMAPLDDEELDDDEPAF